VAAVAASDPIARDLVALDLQVATRLPSRGLASITLPAPPLDVSAEMWGASVH
jgi:hypothetical protein